MPTPLTIDNEIISDINRFKSSPIDEFNFRLLLRKTEKLMQANAAHAYLFRGILYSMRWDEAKTRENFAKAESLAFNDASLLKNIAVTYSRLSFDDESCEYYMRAHRLLRSSGELLKICVESALSTHSPHLAQEAIDIYRLASGEGSGVLEQSVLRLKVYKERLALLDLDVNIAASMYAEVGKIIRRFQIRDQNSRMWFNNEDGISYLIGDIAVDADAELLCQMNSELSDSVVELFSYEDTDKLIYQFVSADSGFNKNSDSGNKQLELA